LAVPLNATFKKIFYLFERERDRDSEREHEQGEEQREREKQAPRSAGSLMWGSNPGPPRIVS